MFKFTTITTNNPSYDGYEADCEDNVYPSNTVTKTQSIINRVSISPALATIHEGDVETDSDDPGMKMTPEEQELFRQRNLLLAKILRSKNGVYHYPNEIVDCI